MVIQSSPRSTRAGKFWRFFFILKLSYFGYRNSEGSK
nr:MAG TPA: hypothetical protein [Caudoviricetes sp.]